MIGIYYVYIRDKLIVQLKKGAEKHKFRLITLPVDYPAAERDWKT